LIGIADLIEFEFVYSKFYEVLSQFFKNLGIFLAIFGDRSFVVGF